MDAPITATTRETVTRLALVHEVSRSTPSVSKADVRIVLEDVFGEIAQTLSQGEAVKLRGFGNFIVRTKGERLGRNPRTLQAVAISPRRALTFRPSATLIEMINNEAGPPDKA
jgi:integration host factor subunit alpha